MGPTWVLSAPDGPHVGPMNLAIRVVSRCAMTNMSHGILPASPTEFRGCFLHQSKSISTHATSSRCLGSKSYIHSFFTDINMFWDISSLKIDTNNSTSNGSWCMGIKDEMSGTVCVTFTWDMYIYIWVVYILCFFCCLFITVTWWYVWCFEWASGNQEEVQACLVTLWLFIISCYSLYKTTLGLLCSWFENNPHFHKYSMDFHV